MADGMIHDTRAADLARDPFAVVIARAANGWIAAVPSEMREGHEWVVAEDKEPPAGDTDPEAASLADLLFDCFPGRFGKRGMRILVGEE